MQTGTLLNRGLEPLAVALILAPEPATTVIGIGLLAYARTQRYLARKEREIARHRIHTVPDHTYRMKLVRGETIVYQTSPVHTGQLPCVCAPEKGLYYDPALWRSYFQQARRKVRIEKEPIVARPALAASSVNRPATNGSAFKRPANMSSHMQSYKMPPLYRPQPAMATGWA